MRYQWLKKYWGLIVVAVGGLGIFWVYQADELMDQRAKYTVGYITGWHFTRSGKHFDFQFHVANTSYVGTSLSDKGMNTANGSRFVVEYDSIDPSTNVGYFAITIPDSIRQAPANGWRTPPFPIPQWILNRGK
jgi:hypothetical protein